MAKLKRALGFWSSVAIGIGAMIGAGIFVLLGMGAGLAGPALPLAFIIAGVLAFLNAASASELAASYPLSGGTYEYAHRLLSSKAGFIAGWIFASSKLLEAATVALAFGAYAAVFLPAIDPRIAAIAAAAAFTIINYFGIRASSEATNILVAIKVAVLAVLIGAGIGYFRPSNFVPFTPTGAEGILAAAALIFFAYTGFARIATIGEEIKNPRKTIPKATMTALGITTFLYVAVSIVAVGIAGSAALASSSSPLAAAAAAISPILVSIVAFGGLVATASVLLGDLLASSRTLFAMGRRKELPAALGRVHKKYRIPHIAEVTSGIIVIGLAALGSLAFTAFLTSLTILLYYAIMNASALELARKKMLYPRAISVLGLVGCIALALFLPLQSWLITAIVIVAGLLYYMARK